MALEFDENGLVDRKKLDKNELKIFIAFLKSEQHRHEQDIRDIQEDIKVMKQCLKKQA